MYKLLIVDDEPMIRKGIKALVDFEKLQIDSVFEATNGLEALEIFIKESIDIVLSDINMPKMNGLDLVEAMKKTKPVKVALITGYDYLDYAIKALKMGVDDYIMKPVSRKDIEEALSKLIAMLQEERKQVQVAAVVTRIQQESGAAQDMSYKAMIQAEIEDHLTSSEFSLTFLAQHMGLSVGYLSGLFKKLFGITFQNYVLDAKLERAKLLLLTTELKSYEIAEILGFEDPNYFSASFKKEIGCSPRAYKEKAKKG